MTAAAERSRGCQIDAGGGLEKNKGAERAVWQWKRAKVQIEQHGTEREQRCRLSGMALKKKQI